MIMYVLFYIMSYPQCCHLLIKMFCFYKRCCQKNPFVWRLPSSPPGGALWSQSHDSVLMFTGLASHHVNDCPAKYILFVIIIIKYSQESHSEFSCFAIILLLYFFFKWMEKTSKVMLSTDLREMWQLSAFLDIKNYISNSICWRRDCKSVLLYTESIVSASKEFV